MKKPLIEMDKQQRNKLCGAIIELKKVYDEYDVNEMKSYGIKITIEDDRDEELMMK